MKLRRSSQPQRIANTDCHYSGQHGPYPYLALMQAADSIPGVTARLSVDRDNISLREDSSRRNGIAGRP